MGVAYLKLKVNVSKSYEKLLWLGTLFLKCLNTRTCVCYFIIGYGPLDISLLTCNQ